MISIRLKKEMNYYTVMDINDMLNKIAIEEVPITIQNNVKTIEHSANAVQQQLDKIESLMQMLVNKAKSAKSDLPAETIEIISLSTAASASTRTALDELDLMMQSFKEVLGESWELKISHGDESSKAVSSYEGAE